MHRRHFCFGNGYFFVVAILAVIVIVGATFAKATLTPLSAYTPCTFPVPGDDHYGSLCSSSFVSANFVCDVHKHSDKTDVDHISNVVGKYECYKSGRVSVGVAIMEKLALPEVLPDASDFLIDSEWYCFTAYAPQLNDVLHWRNGTAVFRYLDKFATVLRRRWFKNDCGSHVLFLTVTESVGYYGDQPKSELIGSRPIVRMSFGKELEQRLGDRFQKSLIKSVFVWHNEGLSALTVVASALEKIGEKLDETSSSIEPESQYEGVPPWAILAFFGCFLIIGFLMLLDYAIVRKNGLTLRGAKSAEPRLLPPARKSENVSVHLYF